MSEEEKKTEVDLEKNSSDQVNESEELSFAESDANSEAEVSAPLEAELKIVADETAEVIDADLIQSEASDGTQEAPQEGESCVEAKTDVSENKATPFYEPSSTWEKPHEPSSLTPLLLKVAGLALLAWCAYEFFTEIISMGWDISVGSRGSIFIMFLSLALSIYSYFVFFKEPTFKKGIHLAEKLFKCSSYLLVLSLLVVGLRAIFSSQNFWTLLIGSAICYVISFSVKKTFKNDSF